jgi:hypothetical protein
MPEFLTFVFITAILMVLRAKDASRAYNLVDVDFIPDNYEELENDLVANIHTQKYIVNTEKLEETEINMDLN